MDMPAKASRPSEGQRALAEAIVRGERPPAHEVVELDASVYIDPLRFERERRMLFDKLPLLLRPSALLPDNNTAIAHDGYGVPLIVSRDGEGRVHVMANVCRHRGTRLIESDEVVSAKRIVCPYHAWTYGSNGDLLAIPRAECFPGVEKGDRPLMHFTAVESGGFIWFSRDPDADFGNVFALAEDMDAFGMSGLHLYRRRDPRGRVQLEAGDGRFPRKLSRPAAARGDDRAILHRRNRRRRLHRPAPARRRRPRRLSVGGRPGRLGGGPPSADLHLRLLPDVDPHRQPGLHQSAGGHAPDGRHLPGRGFHADP